MLPYTCPSSSFAWHPMRSCVQISCACSEDVSGLCVCVCLCVCLQGQEVIARKLMATASLEGQWVLLQNTHLGLSYLTEVETFLVKEENVHEDFRLWITAEPHPQFPIGLLQMGIKVRCSSPRTHTHTRARAHTHTCGPHPCTAIQCYAASNLQLCGSCASLQPCKQEYDM